MAATPSRRPPRPTSDPSPVAPCVSSLLLLLLVLVLSLCSLPADVVEAFVPPLRRAGTGGRRTTTPPPTTAAGTYYSDDTTVRLLLAAGEDDSSSVRVKRPSSSSSVSVGTKKDGRAANKRGGPGTGGGGGGGGRKQRRGGSSNNGGSRPKRRSPQGGATSTTRRGGGPPRNQQQRRQRQQRRQSAAKAKGPAQVDRKDLQLKFEAKLAEMHDRDKKGESLSQSYCDTVLGLCVASDEWDSVLEVLDVMKRNSLVQERSTYRACLDQCLEVGNGKSAMEILRAMEAAGVEPTLEDVQVVVYALCKQSKIDGTSRGIWRRAYNLLMKTADDNNAKERDNNAGEGDNNVVDVEAYNAVLFAMKADNRWKDALQLLHLMEERGGHNHPTPTLSTYHVVLDACVAAGQAEQAVQVLLSLPKKGTKPNSHTFEVVVKGLLKKRQWRRALHLLDVMDELDVSQSTVLYNTVIATCAKAREVVSAMDLLKKMRKRGIKRDVVTFNTIISACAGAGRWKDAQSLLQQCQREPGVEPDIITYTNVIRACARGGKTKDALEYLQVLKDIGLQPDTYCYTAVIDACAKGRMWRRALDLLDEMRQNGVPPSEVTYSVAIAACGNGGQWQRALELLNQMRDKGMKINVITYSSAITALAKAARKNMRGSSKSPDSGDRTSDRDPSEADGTSGDQLWMRALDILAQMKEDGVEPDAYSYSGVISACGSYGQWREALAIMDEMKSGGPRTQPNKITYTAAITACGRAGEWEHALKLFEEMRNDGLQPDRISYNAAVSALRVGNQADKAYEIWGEMCGRGRNDPKSIAPATPDSRYISPDIITLTDIIATLDRSEGKSNREKMDLVFEEAVERGIVLPADSLDSVWEVDLSGMSIPVAHAAVRFVVKRALEEVKNGSKCNDLTFITGVGKAQPKFGQEKVEEDRYPSEEGKLDAKEHKQDEAAAKKKIGTTALREYVRQVLRDDFEPPLYSIIPLYAEGTVQVAQPIMQKWVDEYEK